MYIYIYNYGKKNIPKDTKKSQIICDDIIKKLHA